MQIDESGFLAAEIQHWIKKIRQDHSALFTLANEVNRLCQKSTGCCPNSLSKNPNLGFDISNANKTLE